MSVADLEVVTVSAYAGQQPRPVSRLLRHIEYLQEREGAIALECANRVIAAEKTARTPLDFVLAPTPTVSQKRVRDTCGLRRRGVLDLVWVLQSDLSFRGKDAPPEHVPLHAKPLMMAEQLQSALGRVFVDLSDQMLTWSQSMTKGASPNPDMSASDVNLAISIAMRRAASAINAIKLDGEV